jgi:hypothetical protein
MRDTAVYALLFTIGALMSLALCGAVIQALVWVATIAMTVVQ